MIAIYSSRYMRAVKNKVQPETTNHYRDDIVNIAIISISGVRCGRPFVDMEHAVTLQPLVNYANVMNQINEKFEIQSTSSSEVRDLRNQEKFCCTVHCASQNKL